MLTINTDNKQVKTQENMFIVVHVQWKFMAGFPSFSVNTVHLKLFWRILFNLEYLSIKLYIIVFKIQNCMHCMQIDLFFFFYC